jgi:cephalosporin hydroxylase
VGAWKDKYPYDFTWLGRPIIQLPQDIIALQEIIWETKPDLIIETGIAHGGGLIFYASILELIGKGKVLGIDIDIEAHPMYKRIEMIQGSSVDKEVAIKVAQIAQKSKTMVILDSLHTHAHVLEELNLYAGLVSEGSYLVVCDTIIEHMPQGFFYDRPWDKGNNPATAVKEFLKNNDKFVADEEIDNKLMLTAAPGGYLKKIKS